MRARGFTLVEMMVVIAMLGVLAAIGVVSLKPSVDAGRLSGTATNIADFIARAQMEAITSRRCVRVILPTATTVAFERLNTFDCDTNPGTAPKIDPAAGLWIPVATANTEAAKLTLSFATVPPETTAAALGGGELDQLRFRPSGRLWSANSSVLGDDGEVLVTHGGLTGPASGKRILVTAQGLLCVLPAGAVPAVVAGRKMCP